jgi:hypothetical protein
MEAFERRQEFPPGQKQMAATAKVSFPSLVDLTSTRGYQTNVRNNNFFGAQATEDGSSGNFKIHPLLKTDPVSAPINDGTL